MSLEKEDCSATGNVPNIVEMSFAQMEGQCYKCSTKGHLSNNQGYKKDAKLETLH